MAAPTSRKSAGNFLSPRSAQDHKRTAGAATDIINTPHLRYNPFDKLEFDEEVLYGKNSWFLEWNEKVS